MYQMASKVAFGWSTSLQTFDYFVKSPLLADRNALTENTLTILETCNTRNVWQYVQPKWFWLNMRRRSFWIHILTSRLIYQWFYRQKVAKYENLFWIIEVRKWPGHRSSKIGREASIFTVEKFYITFDCIEANMKFLARIWFECHF